VLTVLLSLCLGIFLTDAFVSLANASLVLFFGIQRLAWISTIVTMLSLFWVMLAYGLMGLTPMIPKRLFLPITLFHPAALLAMALVAIYHYSRTPLFEWLAMVVQVVLGLVILRGAQGRFSLRWPLVAPERLGVRAFSWANLEVFLMVSFVVVLPCVLASAAVCAALAVNHFGAGFVSLHPGGITVQVREYVRGDGKTIQLVPMAHIGEASFYRQISASFPTNSVILMEGVTDEQHLITNQPTYKPAATSLGLAAQEGEFNPSQGQVVMADMDISQFGTNTVGFLNLAMLLHSKGVNAQTLSQWMQYSPPPQIEKQLFEDILKRRNRHLLGEIQAWLPRSQHLVVPWGVAHIPEIATEIQKQGFRLIKTRDYEVMRFHMPRRKGPVPKSSHALLISAPSASFVSAR